MTRSRRDHQAAVLLATLATTFRRSVAADNVIATYWPAYSSHTLAPTDIGFESGVNHAEYFVAAPEQNGTLSLLDPALAKTFVDAAHAQNATAGLTIGGWTGSQWFSTIMGEGKARDAFAVSLTAAMAQSGFDNVEVDWEYPGVQGAGQNVVSKDDSANLLRFFQSLRDKLGKDKGISAAAFHSGFAGIDNYKDFGNVLDTLTTMTYDMLNLTTTNVTGSHAPFRRCNTFSTTSSVEDSIALWKNGGFPANRLLLGIPAYGLQFTNVKSLDQKINDSVLYQPFDESKTIQYSEIVAQGILSEDGKEAKNGYKRYWDDCTRTPMLYSSDAKIMITYEDPQSVYEKASYARDQGLAGVHIFSSTGDTPNHVLTVAARDAMKHLTTATISAIVVCSVLALFFLAAVILYCVRRSRHRLARSRSVTTVLARPAVTGTDGVHQRQSTYTIGGDEDAVELERYHVGLPDNTPPIADEDDEEARRKSLEAYSVHHRA